MSRQSFDSGGRTSVLDSATHPRGWPTVLRWEAMLLVAIVVLVGVTRFSTLDNKLLEAGHAHRQTQTAIQTVGFHKAGIDLLRPPLPVLGAPFTIPFEFPLFQAVASVPMSWGVPADVSNRATALGFFVVTALLLWVLVRIISNRRIAAITMVVFSFSPFALLWSRAALVEYLATAATLGWILSLILWLRAPRWWWVVAAVVMGSIAAMVKVTTALPWLAVALLFRPDPDRRYLDWMRDRVRPSFVAMVAVPTAAAVLWTQHADAVKAASPATSAFTSANLQQWATGTLAQRLDLSNVASVLGRINSWVTGPGWLLLVLAAVALVVHHRLTWLGIGLVPVLAIGTFFNLYVVHDYYLAAVTPALAALVGLTIYSVAMRVTRLPPVAVLVGLTAVWLGMTLWPSADYWSAAYEPPRGAPPESIEIAAFTEPGDLVMVGGIAWDPRILYYADRSGLMLYEPFVTRSFAASLPDLDDYRALYLAGPLSHLAEWAALRPWYSPTTANTLLLGSTLGDLGTVELAATPLSIDQVLPGESVAIEAASKSIVCNGVDAFPIPPGPGTLWLSVRSDGEARAVMRSGIVPVSSESSTLVWAPPTGESERPGDVLTCINEGVLRIRSAAVVGEP